MAVKEQNLKSVAVLSKSLGDENRLRIILALENGKKSVSQIVEKLNLSQPLVSHHLKELRRSLLVTLERQGPFIFPCSRLKTFAFRRKALARLG